MPNLPAQQNSGPSAERRWRPPGGRGNLHNCSQEIPGGTTADTGGLYYEIIIRYINNESRFCSSTNAIRKYDHLLIKDQKD